MEPEPRPRVSDLFHRALARPPEKRSAFLADACADDAALREEVESLLRYEAGSAKFLETPPQATAEPVAVTTAETPMLNRRIGPYTITAPLGAGGMGEVYRARDSKLRRDVAIKILPSHFTSDPERRARFAREARVLATRYGSLFRGRFTGVAQHLVARRGSPGRSQLRAVLIA